MTQNDEIEKMIGAAIDADPIDPAELARHGDERMGPPLSEDEITEARKELGTWQTAATFRNVVLSLHKRPSPPDYFNQPKLKFLHDAFVIAQFVDHYWVDQVRLATPLEQWPDGHIRVGDAIESVEVTSTHGGRQLGREYRDFREPQCDSPKNWEKRVEQIPVELEKAIEAKLRKHYGSPMWLLVYLNISIPYPVRRAETEAFVVGWWIRDRPGKVVLDR
jgi:hypothetical protein